MWPLGHAAIGYLCYSLLARSRHDGRITDASLLALLFGTQFPDLVDKPLSWHLGMLPTGRTLAHSLLVLVPLCLGLYLFAARYGRAEPAVAFSIGAVSHPFVDALPSLWHVDASAGFLLWPIVAVKPYESGPPTILELLANSLSNPWFFAEIVFAAIALVVWYRDGRPGVRRCRALVAR